MGYRSFDWECLDCGDIKWDLVFVEHGGKPSKFAQSRCLTCAADTPHRRIVSLTAEYHGEKTFNPLVHGGNFDTTGHKPLPTMAPLPDLPADASPSEHRVQVEKYKERFASDDWKDLKRQRKAIAKENAEKRKRHAAIARGENVNMRRDKCAGDPKVTA